MANEQTWQFAVNRAMDNTSTTTNWKNMVWFLQAFLRGHIGLANYLDSTATAVTTLQGVWQIDSSCDSVTAGTAGDRKDYWSTAPTTTGNTGTAASIVTGSPYAGAVRLTGVSGMSAASVGHLIAISGASNATNNTPTSPTSQFTIIAYNSATSIDVYNPRGVVADANNGAITWTEYTANGYNATALVGNTAGSAHSWIVLRGVVNSTLCYLTLDLASSSVGTVSLIVSASQPTGGTTTARPTATDEMQASNWVTQSIYNTGQGRAHAGLTSLGDFYFLCSSDGNGIRGTMILQSLAESKAGDLLPIYVFFQGSVNPPSYLSLANGSNSHLIRDPFNKMPLSPAAVAWFVYATAVVPMTTMTTDVTDSAYDDLPVYIYTPSNAHKSIRGRLADMCWAPQTLADGTAEPAAGTPQSVVVGDLWMPTCAALTI